MFQTVFLSIIRSSKRHIQRLVFVRPLLLPATSLARLAAGSSNGLTLYVPFWAPDDGQKNRLKHVERLTEINKLWNVTSCWLYSANILAMRGPMKVKCTCSPFARRTSYSFLLRKPKQFSEEMSAVFDAPHLCAVNFVFASVSYDAKSVSIIFVYFISYTQDSEQTNISYQILTI